jgi:hypothetical protein
MIATLSADAGIRIVSPAMISFTVAVTLNYCHTPGADVYDDVVGQAVFLYYMPVKR